jgi:hypothetical protein
MDLALSANSGNKAQRPSKRTRGEPEQQQLSLENVARLSLATSAELKVLKSAIIRTVLLPNESKYAAASKAAGQQFNEHRQKANADALHAFVIVGHALLKVMATDADINQLDRSMAEAVMSQVSQFSDLYSIFRMCRATRCHDGIQTRIEFAMTGEHAKLSEALVRALTVSAKKHECYGPAPRLPLDRAVGASLSQMRN